VHTEARPRGNNPRLFAEWG